MKSMHAYFATEISLTALCRDRFTRLSQTSFLIKRLIATSMKDVQAREAASIWCSQTRRGASWVGEQS
jgi:hypothetical protein